MIAVGLDDGSIALHDVEVLILFLIFSLWILSSLSIHFFVLRIRGKGTLKQCPPDVIKAMTNDTDHVLQVYNSRGA